MSIQFLLKESKWTAVAATIVALVASIVQFYVIGVGKNKVIIASSPSNALISLDRKNVGKTPLTVELKRGTYTIQATKEGFEQAEHAIYVSENDNNVVNIQLAPKIQGQAIQPVATPVKTSDGTISEVAAEVKRIKSIILSNPEEAATVPILQEKVRVQSEEIKAIREDLKEIKEQAKWYIGTVIAVIVGLLAVIATLFVAQKKN